MAIEMKKTRVKMNKPLYLGMSILDISKMLMYKFWYDYCKPKYGDRAKLCYTDTDSFIIYIKTKYFLKIFLMMLRNGLIRLTTIKMIKDLFQQEKAPGLFKDELGGKIIREFVALRPKAYAYLDDCGMIIKKLKLQKSA